MWLDTLKYKIHKIRFFLHNWIGELVLKMLDKNLARMLEL